MNARAALVRRHARAAVLALAAGALALPAAAVAAPPANDSPAGAVGFAAVTAENGTPTEQQAIAQLGEATEDAGVAACLGPGSFARTVWYRVPAAATAQELRVAATGRTTKPIDLAAYVQPEGAATAVTGEANACAGAGSGGADASIDPGYGVRLRVPAGRDVLIQVGHRNAPGPAEDEEVVLALQALALAAVPAPAGDAAGGGTPSLGGSAIDVALGGATLTQEDPAQPACPSLGSVWRKYVPGSTGLRTFFADSAAAGTVTVFAGAKPTGQNAAGCVNRARSAGEIALSVFGVQGKPLWVRIGTDRPAADATTKLRVRIGGRPVIAGGPGGSPPEYGGSPPCGPNGALGDVVLTRLADGSVRFGLDLRGAPTDGPAKVDIFQISGIRDPHERRLVARFQDVKDGFVWNQQANVPGRSVQDGYLLVRVRVRTANGVEVAREGLYRRWGNSFVALQIEYRSNCGPIRLFGLSRPVFGGPSKRYIWLTMRLAEPVVARLEIRRLGGGVSLTIPAERFRAGVHRLPILPQFLPVGVYQFRLVTAGGIVVWAGSHRL